MIRAAVIILTSGSLEECMVPWSQLRREIIQSFFKRHAWKECRLNFARKEPAVSLVKFDVVHTFTFFRAVHFQFSAQNEHGKRPTVSERSCVSAYDRRLVG